jgi:hypothetical protein
MSETPGKLDAQISEHICLLESQLGLPKANGSLPETLRRKEVESVLDIPNMLKLISRSWWARAPDLDECPEIAGLLDTE